MKRWFTKSALGKFISRIYYPFCISIREYECGFIIKPVNQPATCISRAAAALIARELRDKSELFTWREGHEKVINESYKYGKEPSIKTK